MITTSNRPASSRTAGLAVRLIDLADRVIQPKLYNVENVPADRGFLLVGNHTLLGLQDVPTLVRELERLRGARLRALADHAHFAIPGWRDLLTRLGAVRGTRETCAELMKAGEPVLVFPGGAREVFKRRGQRYQLLWGERLGFARLAIEHGYPVIPFAAVGGDDTYDVILDSDSRIATPVRALATRLTGRSDVGAIVVRGLGPTLVPRPERFYFHFGTPIETTCWSGCHEDRDAQRALRDLVLTDIEEGINFLLTERAHDPYRSLRPRLERAARNLLPAMA
jgi:1-acyl-sn-glycerol-3-phosphate acyltransferase